MDSSLRVSVHLLAGLLGDGAGWSESVPLAKPGSLPETGSGIPKLVAIGLGSAVAARSVAQFLVDQRAQYV